MPQGTPRVSFAAKLSIAYAVLALVWILASDAALSYFIRDAERLAILETYKGAAFVIVTALLLYLALTAQRRREIETRSLAQTRHFEQLANSINDMVLLVDERGQIINANDRAVTAYGYSREELLRMNAAQLRAPELARQFAEQMRLVRERGAMVYETVQRRKDGSMFPIEASARVIEADGRHFVQGILRDISERKQAQQKMLRLNRLYATWSGIGKAIVRCKSREELFAEACRVLHEHGGFVGAGIGLLDDATGRIVPAAVNDAFRSLAPKLLITIAPDVPEGRGPVGTTVREGKPYICNDMLSDPNTVPWQPLARQYGIRSSAAVPLRIGSKVVGVVGVYSDTKDHFDPDVSTLVEEMGVDLSFALDNFDRERRRITAEQDSIRFSRERDHLLNRLQLEFERMPIGCIVADADMTIREWNPMATSIFGYAKDEVIGKNLFEPITPPGFESELDRIVADILESKRTITHTNENITKAGRTITCEWHNTPLSDGSGQTIGLLAMVQDVTTRIESEHALKESETLFRSVVEQSIAGIYIVVDGKLAYANPRCAEIFGYRQDELIGKPAKDFVSPPDRALIEANLCKPIFGKAKSVQYTFRALRKDEREVDIGVHASLITYKGDRAIIGVLQDISERKKAEEHTKQYLVQLEKSMLDTIDAVSAMVELRDPYTSGHERRVGEIAAAIGAEIGLTEEEIKGLRITGHVHDIGKISCPAEILSKPGKLTRSEFDIIKTHAQLGHDILKSVQFPWPIAQTILQHHERVDGSGYPQGLKGDEISLPARILAVADTVEAMASHRPYRPGLGIDVALKEIEEQSGKRYDPKVATACLRLFREKNYRLPN